VSIIGIWEWGVRAGYLNSFFTGQPSEILRFIIEGFGSGALVEDMLFTSRSAFIAFGSASAAAVIIGFLITQSQVVFDGIKPALTLLNATPRVALAPLFIVWFGLGAMSKIAMGVSLVFFIVLNGTLVGIDTVEDDLKTVARTHGASEWEIFRKVVLPWSVPSIFSSLNLGLIYGFLGVVVAEMLASTKGLGQAIQYNAGVLRMNGVLAIILILALFVTFLAWLLQVVERRLLKWR
jgi:NitT/TauT family transport system permease protein